MGWRGPQRGCASSLGQQILGEESTVSTQSEERLADVRRRRCEAADALANAGEPIEETLDGKRKVWRMQPVARRETIALSATQIVSLFLSRRVFDFLTGTGFKEDPDDVFKQLEITLRKRDYDTRNLDHKIFDVNDAPHIYADHLGHVDDIVTALLREGRLRVVHGALAQYRKEFVLKPYTLVVYKKGLYLAGYGHHHKSVRTFSLDGFREIERLTKDHFEYPKNCQPSQLVEGSFGLFDGPRTRVRLDFEAEVDRFVRRRLWHPTQKITKTNGGVELTTEVMGTTEVKTWIPGWGDPLTRRACARISRRRWRGWRRSTGSGEGTREAGRSRSGCQSPRGACFRE